MDISNYDKIEDLNINPDEWFGFIYLIQDTVSGKQYLGKKNFKTNKKVKLGKKELAALPIKRGRTPSKKQVIAESDWKDYYSSCDEIKNDPDKSKYERYLIKLCKSSKELSYWETKYLFLYEVLEHPEQWYNKNILGKFFIKDLL